MPMPTLQQIIGTITGKVAFERTQANFTTIKDAHNGLDTSLATHKAEKASQTTLGHIKTREPFITVTLQNGWTGTLKYAKDDLGIIHVSGTITSGTTTQLTVIATMPTGYRPAVNIAVPLVIGSTASVGVYYLWFNVDGRVLIGSASHPAGQVCTFTAVYI